MEGEENKWGKKVYIPLFDGEMIISVGKRQIDEGIDEALKRQSSLVWIRKSDSPLLLILSITT